MAVSTALAIPAALAYLNARWRLSIDWQLLSSHAKALYQVNKRLGKDRLNIFYVLEDHATDRKIADKPFLLYDTKKITFKQFYELSLRYAGWLHETYKITKGEVVAIDFMNGPQFLLLTMAIWSLGATPALINYNLTGKSLVHSVKTSAARLLIVEPDLAAKVLTTEVMQSFSDSTFRKGAFPLDTAILDHGLQSSLEYFEPYRAPDAVRSISDGRELGVLISTSGTTGLPKQSIVPWGRLLAAAVYAGSWQGLQPVTAEQPDTFYTSMPLYHSSAFMLGFLMCLTNTTTLALSRRFSVSTFWTDIQKYDATVIQYVGETLRYLTNAPVHPDEKNHRVRMAFGNGLRPDVWRKFKTRFGVKTIAEFYGATEGVAASWNYNGNDFSDGAIGQNGLVTGMIMAHSLAIVDVDWETEAPHRDSATGFCKKLPRGEAGELIFKLDPADVEAKFQGYLDNQKATESKVLRGVFAQGDAWYRTGDVVRWDKDGRLWFSDRIGDTFRWKSENVSTAEVGEIFGYHPQVAEANVYGVKVPGYEGRAGCAALVLKKSASTSSDKKTLTADPEVLLSLATFASNSLPRFSVPVFVRLVKEMTVTGNNKQTKHIFRTQGINLDSISKGGSDDRLYWMKPGSSTYEPFERADFEKLAAGQAKL